MKELLKETYDWKGGPLFESAFIDLTDLYTSNKLALYITVCYNLLSIVTWASLRTQL